MNRYSHSQCACTTVEDAQSAVEDLVWQLQVGFCCYNHKRNSIIVQEYIITIQAKVPVCQLYLKSCMAHSQAPFPVLPEIVPLVMES